MVEIRYQIFSFTLEVLDYCMPGAHELKPLLCTSTGRDRAIFGAKKKKQMGHIHPIKWLLNDTRARACLEDTHDDRRFARVACLARGRVFRGKVARCRHG